MPLHSRHNFTIKSKALPFGVARVAPRLKLETFRHYDRNGGRAASAVYSYVFLNRLACDAPVMRLVRLSIAALSYGASHLENDFVSHDIRNFARYADFLGASRNLNGRHSCHLENAGG